MERTELRCKILKEDRDEFIISMQNRVKFLEIADEEMLNRRKGPVETAEQYRERALESCNKILEALEKLQVV